MDTVWCGRNALAIALLGALSATSHAAERPAHLVVGPGEAVQGDDDTVLHVSGDKAIGIRVLPRGSFDAERLSILHDGALNAADAGYGVLAHAGAEVLLTDGRIVLRGPSTIGIQAQGNAVVELQGTAIEVTESAGSSARAIALAGGRLVLRDASIDTASGHAISTHFSGIGTSHVFMERSTIRGDIGSGAMGLTFASTDSRLTGNIDRDGEGRLDVRMSRGVWRGKAGNVSSVALEDSTWSVTADSNVSSLRLDRGGRVNFARTTAGFKTLRAGEWHAGAGAGGIAIGTRLDAGGALQRQGTDRLLVAGDATGSTPVYVVHSGGKGASTAGRGGLNGPADGISVVQVGGMATHDAFRIVGDYVAIGPWQYRLHAFEPGRADPGQALLDGKGADYWDFRLQSTRVDGPAQRSGHRAALAPQVPTYLVLTQALFGYGMTALDALRPVDLDPGREPALRVRAFGGGVAHRSSLPFDGYGFDYRRHDHGMQVAGDALVYAAGDTTLRLGAAASLGGTRVSPRAAEGRSEASVDARGVALQATLTTESAWRVASSYAVTHYRVDVRTPSRGEVLGRLRANANEATLSTEYRWRASRRLTIEPSLSAGWQKLRFSRAVDRDGIDLAARAPERTTLRGGARATLAFVPEGRVLYAWAPYADVRYVTSRASARSVSFSGEGIATGRTGRGLELSTGARFHLWSRVTASVAVTSRTRVGAYGDSGLGARAAAVLAF